ncbi:MAG: hypothetical protein IPO20_10220 [Gammaproteobacteria bacterium]|nr:hypothetical protein [Gammaproteobacteria bacterium]
MDVPGQEHHVVDPGAAQVFEDAPARLRIAVPLVGVEVAERREHDLLPEQTPARAAGLRGIQFAEQPGFLRCSQQLACRI